jgi:predicted RecB family nuclease
VLTASDVLELSETTAAYSGSGLSSLPLQIDLARAALGPEPVYRQRGIERIEVPRADVELDLDLENVEEGVYLWGALITDHAGIGIEAGYQPFASWDPMTQEVEVGIFEELWDWLSEIRRQVTDAGLSFRSYCYNEAVEAGHLKRLGRLAGRLAEVDEFVSSDQWVDLMPVVKKTLITGGSLGLKRAARLAGYEWPVEDPGGEDSMLVYENAVTGVSESVRQSARGWLLDYNRGDVEATLALREWMDLEGSAIPSIEAVDPTLL